MHAHVFWMLFQVTPGHPFGSFVVNTGKLTGLRVKESNAGSGYSQEISLSSKKKADIADPQIIKVIVLLRITSFLISRAIAN